MSLSTRIDSPSKTTYKSWQKHDNKMNEKRPQFTLAYGGIQEREV